jgi:hypothetical protein
LAQLLLRAAAYPPWLDAAAAVAMCRFLNRVAAIDLTHHWNLKLILLCFWCRLRACWCSCWAPTLLPCDLLHWLLTHLLHAIGTFLPVFFQAARMLVQLLGYDPASITKPGQPGYGAGSGAPAVMLAYVKHLWATGDRKEALLRYGCAGWAVACCSVTVMANTCCCCCALTFRSASCSIHLLATVSCLFSLLLPAPRWSNLGLILV